MPAHHRPSAPSPFPVLSSDARALPPKKHCCDRTSGAPDHEGQRQHVAQRVRSAKPPDCFSIDEDPECGEANDDSGRLPNIHFGSNMVRRTSRNGLAKRNAKKQPKETPTTRSFKDIWSMASIRMVGWIEWLGREIRLLGFRFFDRSGAFAKRWDQPRDRSAYCGDLAPVH